MSEKNDPKAAGRRRGVRPYQHIVGRDPLTNGGGRIVDAGLAFPLFDPRQMSDQDITALAEDGITCERREADVDGFGVSEVRLQSRLIGQCLRTGTEQFMYGGRLGVSMDTTSKRGWVRLLFRFIQQVEGGTARSALAIYLVPRALLRASFMAGTATRTANDVRRIIIRSMRSGTSDGMYAANRMQDVIDMLAQILECDDPEERLAMEKYLRFVGLLFGRIKKGENRLIRLERFRAVMEGNLELLGEMEAEIEKERSRAATPVSDDILDAEFTDAEFTMVKGPGDSGDDERDADDEPDTGLSLVPVPRTAQAIVRAPTTVAAPKPAVPAGLAAFAAQIHGQTRK